MKRVLFVSLLLTVKALPITNSDGENKSPWNSAFHQHHSGKAYDFANDKNAKTVNEANVHVTPLDRNRAEKIQRLLQYRSVLSINLKFLG